MQTFGLLERELHDIQVMGAIGSRPGELEGGIERQRRPADRGLAQDILAANELPEVEGEPQVQVVCTIGARPGEPIHREWARGREISMRGECAGLCWQSDAREMDIVRRGGQTQLVRA